MACEHFSVLVTAMMTEHQANKGATPGECDILVLGGSLAELHWWNSGIHFELVKSGILRIV